MLSPSRRRFLRRASAVSLTASEGVFHSPLTWEAQAQSPFVLDLLVEAPAYELPGAKAVPFIDAAATVSPRTGEMALFILNRDLSAARPVEIVWEVAAPGPVQVALVLTGDDLKARNGFDTPRRVHPTRRPRPATRGSRTRLELPPRSYTVIQWRA